MKIFISAGEASGDLHASKVASALRAQYPQAELVGMGGSKMRASGVKILRGIDDLGVIGIVEVAKKLPFFLRLLASLKKMLAEEKPDVLVCVDYPGFNMRLAKAAKKMGIPVVYFIAPTIWAWHRSRGKDIARDTAAVACIFPFEYEAYREMGANAYFVGHPLLEQVHAEWSAENARKYFKVDTQAKKLLLLPGSRPQEVKSLLPDMLAAVKLLAAKQCIQCFLPCARTIDKKTLRSMIDMYHVPVQITDDHIYDLMSVCDMAIAASGTVTLETSLMELPTLLIYRVAPLTYRVGKKVVRLSHIGLPNIVAGREVIPELLQDDVTPEKIAAHVDAIWNHPQWIMKMKEDLRDVRRKLGEPGALDRVASLIVRIAKGEKHA